MPQVSTKGQTMTGSDLRAWRLAHHLTLEQFAHKIGCSWATASRWERGISAPHPFMMKRLIAVVKQIEAKEDKSNV